MATLKTIKRNHRSESLRGKFMVDTVRGVLRIRKWPKKRGTPKSALQLWWIDWFRQANKLAKYADAMSMRLAIKYTAGTGIYPRDLLLKAMRGRLYTWRDENGRMYYPMAGVQDISDTLDILAQSIGSVLVRATDRWRAASSGVLGRVLTHQGPDAPPLWAEPSGGMVQEEVPGSPVLPDGSVAQYDFDIAGYLSVQIMLRATVLSASQLVRLRYSTDGGLTYHSTATSYWNFLLTATVESMVYANAAEFSDGAAASSHDSISLISMVGGIRPGMNGQFGRSGSSCAMRSSGPTFDGPITNIRIFSSAGATFNSGLINVIGMKGS